ncbi:Os11g0257800, partial [Oryza sativa Japonica Group]
WSTGENRESRSLSNGCSSIGRLSNGQSATGEEIGRLPFDRTCRTAPVRQAGLSNCPCSTGGLSNCPCSTGYPSNWRSSTGSRSPFICNKLFF